MTMDLDSGVCEVHGYHKQGAATAVPERSATSATLPGHARPAAHVLRLQRTGWRCRRQDVHLLRNRSEDPGIVVVEEGGERDAGRKRSVGRTRRILHWPLERGIELRPVRRERDPLEAAVPAEPLSNDLGNTSSTTGASTRLS
jgi:hypothetical protein